MFLILIQKCKTPFALSLSKGLPSSGRSEGMGLDKLSPNGGGSLLLSFA